MISKLILILLSVKKTFSNLLFNNSLNLFDSKDTGGDFVLVPATDVDMRGKNAKPKKSLEVMYDEA